MNTHLQTQNIDNLPIESIDKVNLARGENAAKTVLIGDTTGALNVNPKQKETDSKPLIDGSKKTWGEKIYNTLVYQVFGFGVNLGFSSLLTYLTLHSKWQSPILGRKQDGTPRMVKEVYTDLRSWFERSWPTSNIKGFAEASPEVRKDRANVMSGALVLTLGGHIMIPVIKFFEDKKTSIVQWLDKKHYGANTELPEEVSAAHERIAQEIRPTLTSTALARVGSVVAVQLSARTFGIEKNLIGRAAEKINSPIGKDFRGFDKFTETKGLQAAELIPTKVATPINNFLLRTSGQEVKPNAKNPEVASLLKYGFSDIIYTIITAVSIKPMNNWLIRNFSFLRKEPEQTPHIEKPVIRTAGLYSDTQQLEQASDAQNKSTHKPSPNIQSPQYDGHVISTNQLERA